MTKSIRTPAKMPTPKPSQSDKFKESARELECDDTRRTLMSI